MTKLNNKSNANTKVNGNDKKINTLITILTQKEQL